MKIPKAIFPFAGKGKLSGTAVAMHLAVYGALIWLVMQASRQVNDGFQVSGGPPAFISSIVYSFANNYGKSTVDVNTYALLTWNTSTSVNMYQNGTDITAGIYKLYPIDIATGVIRSTPLDFAKEVQLYTAPNPTSVGTGATILGAYLTAAQYAISFTKTVPVSVYPNIYVPTVGKSYSGIWLDSILLASGDLQPVIVSMITGSLASESQPTELVGKSTTISTTKPKLNVTTAKMINDITTITPMTTDAYMASLTGPAQPVAATTTPGTAGVSPPATVDLPTLSGFWKGIIIVVIVLIVIGSLFGFWMQYKLISGAAKNPGSAAAVVGIGAAPGIIGAIGNAFRGKS